jgi:SAM-dependent methyltransferase
VPGKVLDRLRLLKHFFSSARRRGLLRTLRIALYEIWFERKFGGATGVVIPVDRLDCGEEAQAHAEPYFPSSYLFLHEAFVDGPLDCGGQVFLDYGCGMGRALLFASTLPFKRIIGVEVSSFLCETATQNLKRYYGLQHKKEPQWSIVNADARMFEVPDDVTFFYMANPFDAVVVDDALKNIVASLNRATRKCYLIYANPQHEELLMNWGFKKIELFSTDFVIYTSH